MTRRDLAYCLDALVPGLYLWAGQHIIVIGGCAAEPGYPGTVRSTWGWALILPGLHGWGSGWD